MYPYADKAKRDATDDASARKEKGRGKLLLMVLFTTIRLMLSHQGQGRSAATRKASCLKTKRQSVCRSVRGLSGVHLWCVECHPLRFSFGSKTTTLENSSCQHQHALTNRHVPSLGGIDRGPPWTGTYQGTTGSYYAFGSGAVVEGCTSAGDHMPCMRTSCSTSIPTSWEEGTGSWRTW